MPNEQNPDKIIITGRWLTKKKKRNKMNKEVEKLAEEYSRGHMFCLDGKYYAYNGFIEGYKAAINTQGELSGKSESIGQLGDDVTSVRQDMNTEQLTEVIEGNKLIAEFMGDTKYEAYRIFGPEDYDKDWNELMQVVEKIENLGYDVFIGKNACYISKPNQQVVVHCNNFENRITTLYEAVESFIQWYNNSVTIAVLT